MRWGVKLTVVRLRSRVFLERESDHITLVRGKRSTVLLPLLQSIVHVENKLNELRMRWLEDGRHVVGSEDRGRSSVPGSGGVESAVEGVSQLPNTSYT